MFPGSPEPPSAPGHLDGGSEGKPTLLRGRAGLVGWVLPAVAITTLVADALTPRDLSLGEDEAVGGFSPTALALSRLVTAAVVLASAVVVTRGVVHRGLPRKGLSLWLGYMAFAVTCFVVPGLAGRVPGLDTRVLYPPLVFTALYFARPVPVERVATLCRVVLGVTVYGSLVAAVVNPAQSRAADFVGFFSWLDFRLYGIGGGSISLGVQSAVLLAIELVTPSRSRLRWPNVAASGVALVLCQAKTSWLFILAVFAYLALRRLAARLASPARRGGASARALVVSVVAGGLIALAGLTAYQLSQVDLRSLRGGENLTSFTGRTYIWATTLNTWLDDPIFGYGLGLWEGEYRERYAPNFPHAHNQFLQTLGSAGLVGLLGLLAYFWAALRAARRAAPTDPVPLVLLLAMLAHCLTNVPFLGQYLVEPLVVVHLLMFAALVNAEKLAPDGAAEAPSATVAGGA